MTSKIRCFALGGLDENGKNLFVVEINNDIYVLDCGIKYPTKQVPGVDFIIPNFDYLKEHKKNIKAYIITHAHDEKMLALPYIYQECPAKVVTTRFTARMLDFAAKGLGIKVKFDFDYVEGNCSKVIGLHKINFCQVTHSMPFSFGLSINTDQGQVVYTSDYILDWSISDPNFRMDTNALLVHSRDNVLLVLSDSNNANIPGHNSPNYRITNKISKYFEDQEGRVYIS